MSVAIYSEYILLSCLVATWFERLISKLKCIENFLYASFSTLLELYFIRIKIKLFLLIFCSFVIYFNCTRNLSILAKKDSSTAIMISFDSENTPHVSNVPQDIDPLITQIYAMIIERQYQIK